MTLPPRLQVLLSGGREKRIDGQQMDPQIQLLVTLMNADGFTLRDPDHLVARESFAHDMAALATKPPEVAWTREIEVAGGAGPLRARLYVPFGYRAPGPLLVFLHGGGWVVGDIDTHDVPCRFLARHSGAAVVSVDYRLAPEHPFPAPVDDSLAAFRDVVARAEELGADPERIGDRRRQRRRPSVGRRLAARGPRRRAGARAPGPDLPGHRHARARGPRASCSPRSCCWRRPTSTGHRELRARAVRSRRGPRLADPGRGPVRRRAGLHRDRRLRSAARRGRGLRRAPARGGRADDAAAPARHDSRLHRAQ